MTTPLIEYLFNEASSGTTPTTVLNSGSAASCDLPITYSGASWTTIASGNALTTTPSVDVENDAIGSGVITTLSGSKTCSAEFLFHVDTAGTAPPMNGTFGISGLGNTAIGGDLGVDKTGITGNFRLYFTTAADGAQEPSASDVPSAVGENVIHYVIDTGATNRITGYRNGFAVVATNTAITANTALTFGSAPYMSYCNVANNWSGAGSTGYYSWHAIALAGADVLSRALQLFATTDTSPKSTGAQLRQAGTNGGANDASTAISDPTVAPTQTVAATGNNRGLFALITGLAVTTGVTACTFNGVAGTKLTSQTDSLVSLADAEVWWWNDSALPSTAGNYSASITVDGATGTAAATLHYMEGVSQSAPTNFGLATGTGTSITATLTSSATAGSIMVGVLFDITTGDAAVDGSNQLPISAVNGTSTGNTHRHTTSAKYIPTAGANSISWSGLTNATGKIAISVEVLANTGGLSGISIPTYSSYITS
jgi:hypothetical protein